MCPLWGRIIYVLSFICDTIIDSAEGEPIYGGNDLKNYRKKVEFYLKEHRDRLSVYKLQNRLWKWLLRLSGILKKLHNFCIDILTNVLYAAELKKEKVVKIIKIWYI